ncbi:MAG: hypothetical protein Q8O43_09000 [Dehalococcoidia bacterium]|nr:hypothetical protein [Dehalococcoidia bacterium]
MGLFSKKKVSGQVSEREASSQEKLSSFKRLLADTIYTDPKGYFKISAPAGWQSQDFKDDPRGKVRFICPEANNTIVQVIGQANPFSDFEELVRDCQGGSDRIKSRFNASAAVEKTTFGDIPADKLPTTLRSGF